MRLHLIAVSALALIAADGASAQRMVMPGPGMGAGAGAHYVRGPSVGQGSRWGSRVNGHWWAGVNAPGGWNAYRRPVRGWSLPSYWIAPGFAIVDWSSYGLGQPPAGYGWTRYYDDAVLTDGHGRVYDCVSGVDWDRGGYADDGSAGAQGYDAVYTRSERYDAPGYVQPTYGQSTYHPGYGENSRYAATAGYAPGADYAPPPPPPAYAERRNSGVGGALVGGAVGAVAGNVIAGRGHRLEGTLIGAGVGGAAGYAIDRSSTHRVPVAPREGYDYPPPPPPGPARAWHSPDGGTTVTTTSAGGYYGGSTTVVTIQTAPVVTTTTTEIVEDHVTYTRHRAPRHKWVRRRPVCGC